jgi:Uma2 family endonuclease
MFRVRNQANQDPVMASTFFTTEDVRIPVGFPNQDAFRKWARSDDYPAHGWYSYLAGDLHVDPSMEEAFTHNLVKGEYAIVLGGIAKAMKRGYYFHDRMLLSEPGAKLSTEPDGMFVEFESIKRGRIRLIEGNDGGTVELEGSPDMVLEVVSTSSVEKDTVILPDLYAKAGIAEFWLVDARESVTQFDIFRLASKGYSKTRKQAGGWLKSAVFGRSFRLQSQTDLLGNPQFTLESR